MSWVSFMPLARSAVICQAGLIEFDQDLLVNFFQGLQIGQSHMLVNLVDGGVGWAKLYHLRTNLCNEATVAGATRGGQLGLNACHLQNSFLHHVDQAAWRGEEGQATQGPLNFKFELMLVQYVGEALLQRISR